MLGVVTLRQRPVAANREVVIATLGKGWFAQRVVFKHLKRVSQRSSPKCLLHGGQENYLCELSQQTATAVTVQSIRPRTNSSC